jgi:glycosyltransferase involved in cell wall biosynthesis
MSALPRVTVISPNLNQVRFVERAMCSVLDQGYADLEYAVMDGGSCDGSTRLIRQYESELAWWICKGDGGPAAAINRGLDFATGGIIVCLNSDDLLAPSALHRVAERMSQPDAPAWVVGGCADIDANDRVLSRPFPAAPETLEAYLRSPDNALPQPASFFRADVFERFGRFEQGLHHRFAFEFHCRLLAAGLRPTALDAAVAYRRLHPRSMTHRHPLMTQKERAEIVRRYRGVAERLDSRAA